MDISNINVDPSRNVLEIVLRPIHNNIAANFQYGWEFRYRFVSSNQFTYGHSVYASNAKTTFLQHLPIRQVLSYENENQEKCSVRAIHNVGGAGPLAATFPTWSLGLAPATQESLPKAKYEYMKFVRDNANIGDTLNFFDGVYFVVGNTASPTADVSNNKSQELGTKPLLIQCPDLPITGYCGKNGQTPQLLQMASGVNPYNSGENLLYEQFGNNNWIELKNKTQLNLTRLGIVITDVQNQEVNYLEDESVVCLKFRTNNQNIKLGGF